MDKNKHLTILSVLFITFNTIYLLVGIGFITGSSFVSHLVQDATANSIISSVVKIIGSVFIFLSVPAIIAGVGLIYRKSWSRILALIICALKLLNIPFGTALGAYGIWILMQDDTIELFE